MMERRAFLICLASLCASGQLGAQGASNRGQRLAQAARAQVGVTLGYDPRYMSLRYPGGDVPRSTGVCADVIVRAARDAFNIDLQKLVHEDMLRDFEAYPARRTWGSREPDANIDHRRVLNLETYWKRSGARLWTPGSPVAGDRFPAPLQTGDIVTWMLDARLPHVGLVSTAGMGYASVIHNIGNGVEETPLNAFHPHRAAGHYRWPTAV